VNEAAERTLRERLEEDVAALNEIVGRQWTVVPDPFGSAVLIPVARDEDPLPVDELPWSDVVRDFRLVNGRPPRPGARALAARRLTAPRRVQGGCRD
jgi:hypothetical protein